jgi:hypothetical protein
MVPQFAYGHLPLGHFATFDVPQIRNGSDTFGTRSFQFHFGTAPFCSNQRIQLRQQLKRKQEAANGNPK